MLPWVCSVIDNRRRQNVSKNKEVAHEPQASVSLMLLPHFEDLCELLRNRPTVTWNLFVLYYDQKRKQTDTHTCLVPVDFSRIVLVKILFKFQTLFFVSDFLLFSLSYLYTVSSKSFSTSFLAQSRIMVKKICKTAILSQR